MVTWPDGAALPLQEEGPGQGTPPQNAEGVGVDGAPGAAVGEMPRRPVGRVKLRYLPTQVGGTGWKGRR